MAQLNEILEANTALWQDKYAQGQEVMRYPADWIIRFYFHYLRHNIPTGKVFDFGCGSANNTIFLMEQGYEGYGVDPATETLSMISANLESHHMDPDLVKNFSIIPTEFAPLEFEDNTFDVIISNQTLYYLADRDNIQRTCKELSRILRPGGVVFFTMVGPNNYYIKYHAKQIHPGNVYEIAIPDPDHRVSGSWGRSYLVRDEDELKELFSEFDCLTTGYFDQRMFDMLSNFHWIFIGQKPL